MKRFLFLLPLMVSSYSPTYADFGAADVQDSYSIRKKFDAWCGKKRNDCKVTFSKRGISVNNLEPVDFNRINKFNFDKNKRTYTFDIFYKKKSSEDGVARFLFINKKSALGFLGALKRSKGIKFSSYDPRCDLEGYIFQDGYCYTKQQAKELRIKKRGEMLEAIAGALDEQREYDLEREKLDLERFRIMSPQKYEFYIND